MHQGSEELRRRQCLIKRLLMYDELDNFFFLFFNESLWLFSFLRFWIGTFFDIGHTVEYLGDFIDNHFSLFDHLCFFLFFDLWYNVYDEICLLFFWLRLLLYLSWDRES